MHLPSTAEQAMARNARALEGSERLWRWNLSAFPFEPGRRILDVGCGPCLYWREIARLRPQLYLAADLSEEFLSEARARLAGQVDVVTRKLDLLEGAHDAWWGKQQADDVVCFDVLEHIEDDSRAARNLAALCRMVGARRLFVRVPALQAIYGRNDAAIGHFRRYSRATLGALLAAAGLPPRRVRYHNAAGILPWFVMGRLLRRSQAVTSGEGRLFEAVVPVLSAFERLVPPPLGLSLNAVCEVLR
jgi:2-polyprenyl-3-methyl-5-hydroxy-6-metoxy-1,4-benzoquinol methylase